MDLYKLNTRIFSNIIDYNKNTMVYCFAHHISMIEEIVSGLKKYNIETIHIIKNLNEMSGVASYEAIVNKYKEFGINTLLIPFFDKLIHTKNESNKVVDYAIEHKIDNIILCAPVFHILRASLTIISSAIQKGVNIKFSSIIAEPKSWNTLCITHQGKTNEVMHKVLELELDRIYKYMILFDILSFQTILNYLDKFD